MRLKRIAGILAAVMLAAAGVKARAEGLVDEVDPMIGLRGPGSCIAGPCVPNGSIHPAPDTLKAGNGGYLAGQPVVGFSQLHAQGSGGKKSYGNFLLSPQIGLEIDEAKHASLVEAERARADGYEVRLTKDGIGCAVTPTAHCAIYRFTFPESSDAHLVVDVARKLDKNAALDDGAVKIDPATGTITGGGTFSGNWNHSPYTLYFALQVNKAPASVGMWVGERKEPGATEAAAKKQRLGAYLQWSTAKEETVEVKIAVSFISVAQASAYLEKEIPGWDFERVRAAAAAAWNEKLGLITMEGASPEERRKFYTSLYHTMVQPRDRTGDNPNWQSEEPFLDDYYTLWDSWRTVFPLMAIIRPEFVAANVRAMVDRHAHNGYAATGFVQGKEMKTGQGGDELDNVIADACVKKIPGIDWEKAYAMLKADADNARTPEYRTHGWVADDVKNDYDWRMKSGSSTLAFAYNDFCVAQAAAALGKAEDAKTYGERAENWKNVWDDALANGGFSGFVHGKHADGAFMKTEATKGYNTDFYEGTCWIYSYGIPGDVPGMIEKMGGREKFIARLKYALDNKLIDFTNEPSFDTLWWFAAAGRADLCSFWVDKLKAMYTADGYPGDEDNGAMSSLYVFVTTGLFPIAGQDLYYLHGSRVPAMAFHLPGGKTFTILAANASPENVYVQSATLNGVELKEPVLHHADIANGGTLSFVMGAMPSAWGR